MAVGVLVALVVAFAVMAAVLTPWHPLPGAHITAAPLHRFFTSGEIARSDAFFEAARWPSWLGLAVSLALAIAIAFTPFGRALAHAAKRALPRWWLQVLALAVTVVLIQTLATLGFAAWGRTIDQRYDLDRQSWAGWARDIAVHFAITAVITAIVLLILIALARKLPRTWFAPAAAGAAALVVLGSFAYPVVVQPLFMSFTPMQPGPLRTHLLALAHRDGVRVSDVLVADASRRTTAENAYVSGFGATKRIVVYDTLLSAPPKQIELVVAHELGHAKNNDVLTGTIEGAVATAAAMVGLFLLLRWGRLRHPVRAASAADVAVVPLVLGLAVLAQFLALPVQDSMSRQVEARADAHSLQLTDDPHDFIAMQRRLALTNLEHLTPNPVLAFWFDNHPTTLRRIGMALAWERLQAESASASQRVRRGPPT